MIVRVSAAKCDQTTSGAARSLHVPFRMLGERSSGDFGGTMEHLWIDFELIESHAQGRASWPFRFQRRVSGRSKLTGLVSPDAFNVGHYSVRPDFGLVRALPEAELVNYALSLVSASTEVLLFKEKKLGGFNACAFREHFQHACDALRRSDS
jgi:hypothetical protein